MSDQLGEIPLDTAITDKDGTITLFFRLLWNQLQTMVQRIQTVGAIEKIGQTAAIATATAYLVINAGNYRVNVALLKTVADGVSSSLTVTLSWTSRGVVCTKTFAAFTTDTVGANDSNIYVLNADASSSITYAIAYASNTPARMTYDANVTVEALAA